jgi:hypothetical protein
LIAHIDLDGDELRDLDFKANSPIAEQLIVKLYIGERACESPSQQKGSLSSLF